MFVTKWRHLIYSLSLHYCFKHKLNWLKKSHVIYKEMQSFLKNKKYNGNSTCNHLLAMGLATNPQISLSSSEILTPCIIGSFLENIQLERNTSHLALSSPSQNCLKQIIGSQWEAVIDNAREILRNISKICIACNIGNGRKGMNHFINIFSWW